MANFFDNFLNNLAQRIASYIPTERQTADSIRERYYMGAHNKPLKLKPGQFDDNLVTNWVGLAVDRSNSLLFGGGVEFNYEDLQDERQAYLEKVWAANKQEILLQRLGLAGEIWGTAYIEIVPNGIVQNNETIHRLVLLKPSLMAIETDPLDVEKVIQYVNEVKAGDRVIRKIIRRIVTPDAISETGEILESRPDEWMIEIWESGGFFSTWKLISETPWPYEFPPVIHVKNLPTIDSPYGSSGIDDAIALQDKYNFSISNMLKIIRYHANPKTWGRGIPTGNALDKIQWGMDDIIKLASDNAMISNLEMQSDLSSSRAIVNDLRQAIFDVCRVVDTNTLVANAGNLTQFVLTAIYSDALAKNRTRRALYGEALTELNRRLLVLGGFADSTPPNTKWGPELKTDETADAQIIINDLAAGIISRQTAAESRGYKWDGADGEAVRIKSEQSAATNAGAQIVRDFLRNRNQPPSPVNQ